jgi:predicted nucleotidyltransferase
MVTIGTLEATIAGFLSDLQRAGLGPERAVLFGSYAKGNPHEWSDIDLAVWARGFEGIRILDIPKILPILRPYIGLELHPFAAGDTRETKPFIEEIERTGKDYSGFIPAC